MEYGSLDILSGSTSAVFTYTWTASYGAFSALFAFTIEIKDPCASESVVSITGDLDQINYVIGTADFTFTYDPFTVSSTDPATAALCGDLVYTVFVDDVLVTTTTSPVFLTGTAFELGVFTDLLSLAGTSATYKVQASFTNQPLRKYEPTNLILFIDPCDSPISIQSPVATATETYAYEGTPTTFTPTPFVADPADCPITYSCAVVSAPTTVDCDDQVGLFFDSSTGAHTFNFDISLLGTYPAGTYVFDITGTVGNVDTLSDKVTVTWTLIADECLSSTASLNRDFFPDITNVRGT